MLDALLTLDATLARAISHAAGWPPLDVLFVIVTVLGVSGWIWFVVGLVLALRRGGHVAEGFVRLFWSLVLTSVIVGQGIKPFIGRARPDVAGLTRSSAAALATSRTAGHSFPSGHAAQAAAGAYALALMWPRRRGWIYTLGALVALSRVYLGVHYPLDVIGGVAVGWAVARVATAGTPCYISRSASEASDVPR
jgi:undecaprenyl-diphosphatase